MKRILVSSTLVTTTLGVILLLAPSRVQAATAHEKFVSMRSALAKAFASGELSIAGTLVGSDTASFSAMLDGSPLPPDIPISVSGEKHEGYTDYTVKIDFSDANYSTISFGDDKDTLKLVPKSKPDQVDIVRLDPKSGKPLKWSEYKNGSTKPVTSITYKSKPVSGDNAAASKAGTGPVSDVVTAHIRFVTR